MKFFKKIIFIVLFLVSFNLISSSQVSTKKFQNEFEISFHIFNQIDFKLAGLTFPEIGYSRYLGRYFKTGIFYQYKPILKGSNQEFSIKASLIPLPFFITNDKFNEQWELEASVYYQYMIQKTTFEGAWPKTTGFDYFARIAISHQINNKFYLFSNIDIWRQKSISLGVRYKF